MHNTLRELQRQADAEPEDRARAHAAARALARSGDSRGAFERLYESGLSKDERCRSLTRELAARLAADEASPRAKLGPSVELETAPPSPSLRPEDARGPVIRLRFPRPLGEDELASIAAFASLRALSLERPCRISEEHLELIADCRELRQLRFSGASLPRRAEALAKLERLELLSLNNTAIDDAALEAVLAAAPLRQLNLGYVARSQNQRRLLATARGLRSLSLVDSGFRSEDLAPLGALEQLENLMLSFNDLGDEAWEELAGFPKLKRLGLIHTGVDAKIGPALRRMTALEEIDLRGTLFGGFEVVRLLDVLPKVKILGLPRGVHQPIVNAVRLRGVTVKLG